MTTTTGVVHWDLQQAEWASHFFDQKGEYGHHLIIGHTTGLKRHGSCRNIGTPPVVGPKPSPKTITA